MVSLILVVCIAATPSDCHEERPPVDVAGVTCMVRGELIAVEWLQEHPKWVLSGWRCKFGNSDKET